MKMHKWLRRDLGAVGPYLTLVLTEAEFVQACADLGVRDAGPWVSAHANATVHTFDNKRDNKPVCIVALGPCAERDGVTIACILVHEAVHVWQRYAESIGEDRPGAEQEANAIQAISYELLTEYARRLEGK